VFVGELFETERDGDTLIVVPAVDLRELEYQRIEEGAREVLDSVNRSHIKSVVMDLYKTDDYGSTALGFFVKLWKRISRRSGRMAFCNAAPSMKWPHAWTRCSRQAT
jgi:anti-anti-sigma regulatory factor